MTVLSRRKNVVILTICILLLLILAAVFAYDHYGAKNIVGNPTNKQATSQETKQSANKKSDLAKDNSIPTSSNSTSQPTYTAPNSSDAIKISASQMGSDIVITTKLNAYSDGECSLSVKKADEKYTASAPVIFQSAYSTCAGFSVPKSSLGAGLWQIEVAATSSGTTASSSIEFEVK